MANAPKGVCLVCVCTFTNTSILNSIYPVGSVFTGNSAPGIGTWQQIGLSGTGEIPTNHIGQFSFNGQINCNGTNYCQGSLNIWLSVQNINQTISFLLVGLRASQLHGFSINEHLTGTTTLVHARNNNVRVTYINNGEGIEIDTNQG